MKSKIKITRNQLEREILKLKQENLKFKQENLKFKQENLKKDKKIEALEKSINDSSLSASSSCDTDEPTNKTK
jgi:hypothetical protein